jgi:ATP-dependent RNA helicase DHX8/PRP22
MSATL